MTATKKDQNIQLTPQQVQAAAQCGVNLIKGGRVDVPSDMAMNGTLQVLNAALSALAQGIVILADPKAIAELQEKADGKPKPKPKAPRKKAPTKKKTASKKKTTKR